MIAMNTEQALSILKTRLEDVRQVDDQVLRGIRRYKDRPYAVFYIDISGKVEERAEKFVQFQDRVLGRWYFDESSDLRWNSYFLLLAEESRFKQSSFVHARGIVEADRNYARKFVIPENELDLCLNQQLPKFDASPLITKDILLVWKTLLKQVDLDDDVLGDEAIAPIARRVVDGSTKKKPTGARAPEKHHDDVAASGFLNHIKLKQFRDYPNTPDFDFGVVNLIRGANGVGKTTLLEAIEFLYCGRNQRSASPIDAQVEATIKGGRISLETSTATSLQLFRDRHLNWYGKQDIKRNLMSDSFANFNFLNTDAAVRLSMASDPDELKKDLATLLMGAEAGRVWDRIGRVIRELQPETRSLEGRLLAASANIKFQEERLAAAKSVVRKSDELFLLLKEHLAQLKWRRMPDIKTAAVDETQIRIVTVESTLQSASALLDLPTEFTKHNVNTDLRVNKELLERAISLSTRLATIETRKHEIEVGLNQRVVTGTELKELERYVLASFLELVTTIEKQRGEVVRLTNQIEGLDPAQFTSDEIVSSDMLQKLQIQVAQREETLREAAQTARKLFDAFKLEHTRAASLSQELRSIAQQILEGSASQNICPLCHTEFGPGELHRHILSGIDTIEEARVQELSKAVDAAQRKYLEAQQVTKQIGDLLQFSSRSKLDEGLVSPRIALNTLKEAVHALATVKRDVEQIQLRLQALESSGFSTQRAILLCSKLFPKLSGPVLNESIQEALLLNKKEMSRLTDESSKLELQLHELGELLSKLNEVASLPNETNVRQAVIALQKRTNNLSLAINAIQEIDAALALDEESPLAAVLSTLRVTSSIQQQLKQSLTLESTADKSTAEATKALSNARQEEILLKGSLKRVRDALVVLNKILKRHSLEAASKELLEANRSQVAAIFSRIHSPHEFEISNQDAGYLQRITTKQPINLKEISTGQRAAYALSIFLAMNAYAKKAPPIILIDDPVAHVDDLNTLSFLDYLRDLAVSEERQIFFTTADDKLAALFEHKFSFLKDDFKKYLLTRD